MVKAPRHVDVGPYRYKVVLDRAAIDRKSVEFEHALDGKFDLVGQTITLSPELGFDGLRDTLLHELLHALLVTLELDGKKEERIVLALAPLLLDTLRRNPKLVRFLLGERSP